jgi:hypothetical protein
MARYLLVLCVTIASLVCLLTGAYFSPWFASFVSKRNAASVSKGFYSAENAENTLYVLSLLLLPIIVFLATWSISKLKYSFLNSQLKKHDFLVSLILAFLLLSTQLTNGFGYQMAVLRTLEFEYSAIFVFVTFVAFSFYVFANNRLQKTFWFSQIVSILAFVSMTCRVHNGDLFSNQSMLIGHVNQINFNANFHGVVQAYLGKLGLLDYYAQYGLYSMLIRPVFLAVELTAQNFVWLSLLLIFLSVYFFYTSLCMVLQSKNLALMTVLAASFVMRSGMDIPYLANTPYRVIFPSAIGWLMASYLNRRSTLKLHIIALLGVLSIFWNFETGVILILTSILVICTDTFFNKSHQSRFSRMVRQIGVFLVWVVFLFGAYSAYSYFVSGEFINYLEFTRFQKIFYIGGIVALTMPLFGPWILVFLTYVGGLVYVCGQCFEKKDPVVVGMILFWSLFGLGWFAYYQGRSHDLVLLSVLYPAVFIVAIFYRLLTKRKLFPIARLILIGPIIWWASCTFTKGIVDLVQNRFKNESILSPYQIPQQYEFLKELKMESNQLLILSDNSGLFHLWTATVVPIRTAGPTELVVRNDLEAIEKSVADRSSELNYVLLDLDWHLIHNQSYALIVELIGKHFEVVSRSPDGRLSFYRRMMKDK